MANLAYKTVTLDYPSKFLGKTDPDFSSVLNQNASEGWRLVQVLEPTKGMGETSEFILILERDTRSSAGSDRPQGTQSYAL